MATVDVFHHNVPAEGDCLAGRRACRVRRRVCPSRTGVSWKWLKSKGCRE
ncbi:hypothetical protein ACO0M4_29460 [Streptomyces sp. RGM 3693]